MRALRACALHNAGPSELVSAVSSTFVPFLSLRDSRHLVPRSREPRKGDPCVLSHSPPSPPRNYHCPLALPQLASSPIGPGQRHSSLGLRSSLSKPADHIVPFRVSSGRNPSPFTPRAMSESASAGISLSELARSPPALPLAPLPEDPKVKVALCQLAVTSDKAWNISHAREVIETVAQEGAQLILLPEMWNCPYSNDSFPTFAEEISGPEFAGSPSAAMLSSVAAAKRVTIVGGSIPERRDGKLYNTSLVFGKDGKLKGKFSKIHLFDIDIPGKMTFKESLTLTPGNELLVVDTEVGRIGVSICYDIRFPELAMLYAARGVHILCYPGAFNMTTGPLHWELLQRASGQPGVCGDVLPCARRLGLIQGMGALHPSGTFW